MERRPSPSGAEPPSRAESIDEHLREALAPEPEAARRLARQALSESAPKANAGRDAFSRWQPAVDRAAWAFATVLVAAVAVLVFLGPGIMEVQGPAPADDPASIASFQPSSTSPHSTSSHSTGDDSAAPSSRAVVTISNETGAVTVTSRGGTAWILLPGGTP